jgi:hypothetical protein
MRLNMLLSVACQAVPYSATLSHKGMLFGTYSKCAILPTNLFESFLVPRIIQRDITKNINKPSYEVTLICGITKFTTVNTNIKFYFFLIAT